jgi:uncharacterized protein (DUF2336 family)
MAKRNVDRVFEKVSLVSGAGSTDRASVLEHLVDAAPMDAVDGTESEIAKAVRSVMLNRSSIDDLMTEF